MPAGSSSADLAVRLYLFSRDFLVFGLSSVKV